MKKLSVIVPLYNEQEVLPLFFKEIEKIRLQLPVEFEYLFINDGSTDLTLQLLRGLQENYPERVHYISFSRNFGKEAAIYAGLQASTGDFVSLLDADLQDPPDLLLEMYERLEKDVELDCLAARRVDRSGESFLVSLFSKLFYKIMNKISRTPVLDGVRDFRLMRRPMVDAILQLAEVNRFSKGLFTWVGYNTDYISYHNQERKSGKTKWSFGKKFSYAVDGFVNFSEAPLNLAAWGGLLVVLFDLLAIVILIVRQLFWQRSVSGWTSAIVINLLCFALGHYYSCWV